MVSSPLAMSNVPCIRTELHLHSSVTGWTTLVSELNSAGAIVCFICRDGGNIIICGEAGCEMGICTRCLGDPTPALLDLPFKCIICHRDAEFNRQKHEGNNYHPQPYEGFVGRTDGGKILFTGGIPSRSIRKLAVPQATLLLVYTLTGFPLSTTPVWMLAHFLEMAQPHNYAYLQITFDLATKRGIAALEAANRALMQSLKPGGKLESIKRIFVLVVSHTVPGTGDLHYTANNKASAPCAEVMDLLLPSSLLVEFCSSSRKASGHFLTFLLPAKVKVWYNNNIALFRSVNDQTTKGFTGKVKLKRWDAKSVAREDHQERYDEIKKKLQEEGVEWNVLHRQTMAKLWEELDANEQQECEAKAVSRNTGIVKEDDKRKLAHIHADKEVIAFVKKMHDTFGVRILCFAAWTNPDGKAETSVHETTMASPRFSQQFPRWKTMKALPRAFMDYSELFADSVGEESDEGEEKPQNLNKAKYPWAVLDSVHAEDGDETPEYPILPEIPKGTGQEWVGGAKILIHEFVKTVYRIDTGSSLPPWGAMATPDGAWELIKDSYLPKDRGLRDPSRMVKAEVNDLYMHWFKRQEDGKTPLKFKVAEAKKKQEEDRQVKLQALKRKKQDYIEVEEENETHSDDNGLAKTPPKKKTKKSSFSKSNPASKAQKQHSPIWSSWEIEDVDIGPEFFDVENNSGHLSNWQAVVEWMGQNPHIATNGSDLSHTQVSEVLLVIGLTHRVAKACATADPDSPWHKVPFEISDLEKIEVAISNMLMQAKSLRKFGVSTHIHCGIENSWKKVCLEVGLADTDINAFGKGWKAFVEVYATVDVALMRSGKTPQLRAPDLLPDALDGWSHAPEPDGNLRPDNETNWQKTMGGVCKRIVSEIKAASAKQTLDILGQE
ncbi:hypothetical protein MSAN_01691600 [Mycena sanguinolenta]|uniref:Uncharacterized protein n=1 Tax=Mycena sanguinolenta TaxID=230812 RepID=A0A8H6XYX7_9AGAR|nr:hypothetical protein MSAN_01691600 [Mycena sanguinolenta]